MTETTTDIKGVALGKSEALLQLVCFKLGEGEFGVDILKVREIIRMMDITHVPDEPDYVEGVVNLRGNVIPVVDLRERFGMERKAQDKHMRIMVMETDGTLTGFIVDAVSEVLRIPTSLTEPPPHIVAGVNAEYITAIGKLDDKLLTLLDIEKVLAN